jgi:hypothetical protein
MSKNDPVKCRGKGCGIRESCWLFIRPGEPGRDNYVTPKSGRDGCHHFAENRIEAAVWKRGIR